MLKTILQPSNSTETPSCLLGYSPQFGSNNTNKTLLYSYYDYLLIIIPLIIFKKSEIETT